MHPQSYAATLSPPVIAHPSAVKLAGHLESTIAACSELTAHSPAAMGYFYEEEVRRVELKAIMHLLQARDCARETAMYDRRLEECVQLFITGTEALERSLPTPSQEMMLGRRLPVSTALQFASLMLRACDGAYPHLAEEDSFEEGLPAADRADAA
jgi:hypothetical protein